jgi:hypothetical protein
MDGLLATTPFAEPLSHISPAAEKSNRETDLLYSDPLAPPPETEESETDLDVPYADSFSLPGTAECETDLHTLYAESLTPTKQSNTDLDVLLRAGSLSLPDTAEESETEDLHGVSA